MSNADAGWVILIGATEPELEARFGPPAGRRATGDDVWSVFDLPAGQLRTRSRKGRFGEVRVASWTLTFAGKPASLAEAALHVGLWPAAMPDAIAAEINAPLVRRAIAAPGMPGVTHSLTATVRGDAFDRLSMFDEPPDWL